jgi:hypothetical protein
MDAKHTQPPPDAPAVAAPRSRRMPARKGPPGRRDQRRPDTRRPEIRRSRPDGPSGTVTASGTSTASGPSGASTATPTVSALRAAAARERERQPPFWFASRLVLVLSGQRPVHSLLGHTRGPAYEQLAGLAPYAPLRPRGADRTTPAVLDARGSVPREGVIEAFARISTGNRQRAMAFRLELCPDRRWRCAAVELDGRPADPDRRPPRRAP